MFQLTPGAMAMIIGARTAAGRVNIGKSVELFALYNPGDRFINPVNGITTEMPRDAVRSLWLVTGDVSAPGGQQGFAFVRPEHLMPLMPDTRPEERDALQFS